MVPPRAHALAATLVQCLTEELPEIHFTLDEHEPFEAVWLCGFGARAVELLGELRAQHPAALIVVSGPEPHEAWARRVLAAGADLACGWPIDYGLLRRALLQPHAVR